MIYTRLFAAEFQKRIVEHFFQIGPSNPCQYDAPKVISDDIILLGAQQSLSQSIFPEITQDLDILEYLCVNFGKRGSCFPMIFHG